MANKYKFKPASYDVFLCIQNGNIYYGKYSKESKTYTDVLDSITHQLAKEYLYKTGDTVLINQNIRYYYR